MTTCLRIGGFVVFGLALSGLGCQDRLYNSGETISLIDGGSIRPDASAGAGRTGSTGGRGGAGGAAGAAGITGAAGAGATDGGTTVCDNNSPLRQTDVANCGTCFNECFQINADATCVAGKCQYSCFTGFVSAGSDPVSGCECTPTNNGTEICDGVDNNCNGTADEGFDLMSDLANCGGCN